jgi:hypothetical protein
MWNEQDYVREKEILYYFLLIHYQSYGINNETQEKSQKTYNL